MCEFDNPDKAFASDLYLIYKRLPSARVCMSHKYIATHCTQPVKKQLTA